MASTSGAVRRFGRALRRQVLWTAFVFGVGTFTTWWYREAVFAWMLAPAKGRLSPYDGLPIFTSPTEVLSSTIQLALMGGAVSAAPLVTRGAFRLIVRLVEPKDRRFVNALFPAALLLPVAGVAFAYYVLVPTALVFLLGFGVGIATPTIRIADYMSLLMALLFWMGVAFELPLLMLVLARLRLVSYTRFRRWRKWAVVTMLLFTAIITPTGDIVNWLIVAGPIIALYQVGLGLAWLVSDRPPSRCWRVVRRVWSILIFVVGAALLPALLVSVVVALLRYAGALD